VGSAGAAQRHPLPRRPERHGGEGLLLTPGRPRRHGPRRRSLASLQRPRRHPHPDLQQGRPHRCLPNAPPHDAWSAIWTTGGAAEIRAADHLLGIPAAVPARYGAASSVQSAGADACWTPTADADAAACAPAAASTTSRRTPRQCGTPGSRPGGAGGRRERATDQAIAPGCLRPPPHTVAEQPLTQPAVPEAPPGRAVTLPADAIVLRHCDGDTPGRPPTCQIEGWPAACSCR